MQTRWIVILNVWNMMTVLTFTKRIAISQYTTSPYLSFDSSSTPLLWHSPRVLRMLHSSCFVEVSARGMRGVHADGCVKPISKHSLQLHKWDKQTLTDTTNTDEINRKGYTEPCLPDYENLCTLEANMKGGIILPSNQRTEYDPIPEEDSTTTSTTVLVTGKQNPIFNSTILSYYHFMSRQHCGNIRDGMSKVGSGRVFESYDLNNKKGKALSNSTLLYQEVSDRLDAYTITSCDVFQSNNVLVFEPSQKKISIVSQTFGPLAYFVVLLISIILLYGISITYSPSPNMRNENTLKEEGYNKLHILFFGCVTFLTGMSLAVMYWIHGISFIVFKDELYFIISTLFCVLMSLFGLWHSHKFYVGKACFYGINSICTAIYRSPENPYSFMLTSVIALETWNNLIYLVFQFITEKQSNSSHHNSNIKVSSGSSAPSNANATVSDNTVILIASAAKSSATDTMNATTTFSLFFNTMASSLFLCMSCELGLLPQFEETEDWILYASLGCFATFSVAVYQEYQEKDLDH